MTRKGSASESETGSIGTLSRWAESRAVRNAKIEEMRVARAMHVS
jgi:hypothetical protein